MRVPRERPGSDGALLRAEDGGRYQMFRTVVLGMQEDERRYFG